MLLLVLALSLGVGEKAQVEKTCSGLTSIMYSKEMGDVGGNYTVHRIVDNEAKVACYLMLPKEINNVPLLESKQPVMTCFKL